MEGFLQIEKDELHENTIQFSTIVNGVHATLCWPSFLDTYLMVNSKWKERFAEEG